MKKFAITCTEMSLIINALEYAITQVESSCGEINAFLSALDNDTADQLACACDARVLMEELKQISSAACQGDDVSIDVG